MKPYLFLSLCFCAVVPVVAQDNAPQPARTYTAQQQAFLNLPEEKRNEYVTHIQEARRFLGEQRVFEAFDVLAKAEAIFEDDSDRYNLLGSCYIEIRDFDKALEAFKKADELSPNNPSIRFNISEVYFVTGKWAEADAIYAELLTPRAENVPNFATDLARLIEFKSLLCKLKLGKKEEVEVLANKYDFLDDSPYYYYAHAAQAYAADDKLKAEEWLARARKVYRDPKILGSWQDTLVEFGYIESFYGGDTTEVAN